MTENQYNEMNQQPTDEQEIDLLELAQKLWKERRLIIKACVIAAVVGIVVAFSIPKVYTTSVTLAPESGRSGGGGLSSLAALAGVNTSSSNGGDALTVNLYPDIVSSTPFLTGLFDVRVSDPKKKIDTTLYDYMLNYQKSPWWSYVTSAPFRLIGWTFSLFRDKPAEEATAAKEIDTFQLTPKQSGVMGAISSSINVTVDNKTGLTTIEVSMQNPVISAAVTDTVMNRLQEYITNYRTMKARHDLAYTEKLYEESRDKYYKAQQRYARYIDSNQNIILSSYRTESERLQNEMNLAYGVYNQTAQQLQAAKARVMEITPVYTVVQPATVPLRASKPKKSMLLIGFVFLAFVGTSAWILFGRDLVAAMRNKGKEDEEAEVPAQA
jgi:uncharacterized protein involved in exopolysaccharide biosynthesis